MKTSPQSRRHHTVTPFLFLRTAFCDALGQLTTRVGDTCLLLFSPDHDTIITYHLMGEGSQ